MKRPLKYLVLSLLAFLFLMPFLWMLVSSFKPQAEIFASTFPLRGEAFWVASPTLEHYVKVFEVVPFARYLLNTLFVALAVVFGHLFIVSLAAYSFARLQFPGRETLFIAVLSTMIIPGEVTFMPLFLVIRTIGWIDRYAALIVPPLFGVFGLFLLRQFFRDIPRDLEDSARIDGCSVLGVYWHIILPLSKSALITLGLLVFIGEWGSFLWPLVVMNTPSKQVIQVGIANFTTTYGVYWGRILAASAMASVPVMALFIALQRYYVRGIVMSGLKG
jgi:multiple sugar transport system permease protein